MDYIYQKGSDDAPVFILLHGTGGDEEQMLSLGQYLNPQATLLSVRGTVTENGMNRFFKRKAEGVYDLEDLNQRGKGLHQWLLKFAEENMLDLSKAIYVGFSNGSNIAINMLLKENTAIRKGILFAPMYPLAVDEDIDLQGIQVYLSMGSNDPICPVSDSQNVINLFESRGGHVTSFWVNGHEITGDALSAAKGWLQSLSHT